MQEAQNMASVEWTLQYFQEGDILAGLQCAEYLQIAMQISINNACRVWDRKVYIVTQYKQKLLRPKVYLNVRHKDAVLWVMLFTITNSQGVYV